MTMNQLMVLVVDDDIYATGIPRHIALSSGLVNPGAPYLEKPVSPDTLESLIRGQVTKFVPARDVW